MGLARASPGPPLLALPFFSTWCSKLNQRVQTVSPKGEMQRAHHLPSLRLQTQFEISLVLLSALWFGMSLSTCPLAQPEAPDSCSWALLPCNTPILNLSPQCLLCKASRLCGFPLLGASDAPPGLLRDDLWLHFQATILPCSLSYGCFQQVKHPPPPAA